MQRLRQSDVLCLHRGQHNLFLQLATPDDWVAGIQYGLAGTRIGGALIVDGGRAMPIATKFGVIVHFEDLVTFWVHHDSLRRVGNIRSGALLLEVELSQDFSVAVSIF